jgi:thiamine pyrophosphate-dependent acetolactate synthase large subunit-like protein
LPRIAPLTPVLPFYPTAAWARRIRTKADLASGKFTATRSRHRAQHALVGHWIRQSGEQRIIGSFNNDAVGTALGQANGIQALDRSRQVTALCGDGGFNMLMCEFLTAVHYKLQIKALVYNNSAFGLIALEAEAIGVPAYYQALDFPNPDYVALARACGGVGFKANSPASCAMPSTRR